MLKSFNTEISRHIALTVHLNCRSCRQYIKPTLTGHLSCRSCRQYIKPTSAPPVDSSFSRHSLQSEIPLLQVAALIFILLFLISETNEEDNFFPNKDDSHSYANSNKANTWLYNPHTQRSIFNDIWIQQSNLELFISAVHMQCKYLYWLYFNKYKITTIPLLQPHPQATAFLLATMWFARTPSDAFCYHKHTMSCLPFVLDVLPLVIYNHTSSQRASVHITLVAIYPSNTFIPNFIKRSWQRK